MRNHGWYRLVLSAIGIGCAVWVNQAAAQVQPQGAQPVAGNPDGAQPQFPMGNAPFPPLSQPEQQFLDGVLLTWEKETAKIQRFESKFRRWQYDPTATNNPQEFFTAGSGVLRYQAPDKGMFQVEELLFRREVDGKFQYQPIAGQFGEWWICDGTHVHIYDRTQKKVKKQSLPPDMRGAEVFNSPLPFVFGVNAAKIQARYWIRPLPHPTSADGKVNDQIIVIEAHPKYQADRLNYHHVTILLDRQTFMPEILEIALTNWTPQQPHREVFQFLERDVNSNFLDKIKEGLFRQAFIPNEPPKDWTVEESPLEPIEPPVDPAARRAEAPAVPLPR